jgi:Family of unknown function (DUF6492)
VNSHRIITVTYAGDLAQLYLHAKSLAKFWKGDKILTLIIEDNLLTKAWCEKHILPILENWQVTFLGPMEFKAIDGWYRQQFLRLIAAKQTNEDWAIVLGSGNILVRDFYMHDIIKDNKILTNVHDKEKPRSPEHLAACQLLDVDPDQVTETWNITPFFWKTSLVRQLFEYLEIKQINLLDIKKSDWTEATLYWNYAQHRYPWYNAHLLFTTGTFGGTELEHRLPWDELIERIHQSKNSYYIKIFNIHRFAVTPAVAEAILNYFQSINLIDHMDAEFYIEMFKLGIQHQYPGRKKILDSDWSVETVS